MRNWHAKQTIIKTRYTAHLLSVAIIRKKFNVKQKKKEKENQLEKTKQHATGNCSQFSNARKAENIFGSEFC